jgi:CheY-like chemotaxis protein
MLEADGHDATRAGGCTGALARRGETRLDAVLLDLRMPGTDGFETARRIRMRSEMAASTPLIAVAADDSPATSRACEEVGMVGFITRPIERDRLLATLERLKTNTLKLIPT